MALGKIFVDAEKRRRRKARAAAKAARLAPPEEKTAAPGTQVKTGGNPQPNGNGALVFDPGALRVPNEFSGEDHDGPQLFGVDAVVVVIIGIALLFIAFISFLIFISPVKE